MMKNLMKLMPFLMLVLLATFVACDQTALQDLQPQDQARENTIGVLGLRNAVNTTNSASRSDDVDEDGDGDEDTELDECFEFVFPIEIVFPDGSTQVANNDDEIDEILEQWFDQNENTEDFPTLAFPIDITRPDGSTVTINSEEELEAIFEECYEEHELECDEDDWGYDDDEEDYDDEDYDDYDEEYDEITCIEIVFPITVQYPDGSTHIAEDEDSLFDLFEDWFEAYDDDSLETYPTFIFPIEVIVEDSTIILNSEEELEDLEDELECFDEFWEDCFEILFPITINLPDGTSVVANSYEECDEIFENWFDQNPDSEEEPEIAYPFDVELEDGTIETINNDEEFEALFDTCYEDWDVEVNDLFSGDARNAPVISVLSIVK